MKVAFHANYSTWVDVGNEMCCAILLHSYKVQGMYNSMNRELLSERKGKL